MRKAYASVPFAMILGLVLLSSSIAALDNGMARTPALGWSTWCGMGPCGNDYCSEEYVMSAAMAMLANGMHGLGYTWIIMDDCWAAESRAADGSITWDTARFPHGIPFLADWMHERNFSFGLYTSAGNTTCSSGGLPKPIPGSEGHYVQDANTFASWNLDYVKVDWCGDVKNMPIDGIAVGAKDYKAFSAALTNSTPKRNMYFEGVAAMLFLLWEVETYVNAWRASTDHHDQWSNLIEVLATVEVLEFPSVPGAWSYMDVLMTGGEGCQGPNQQNSSAHCPGMTDEEYRTEYTLWSMYQSPLVVATDVRNITAIMHELLFNRRILQIHQDTRTPPGKKVGADASCGELDLACQLYARPLADGSALVALFNTDASTTHNITMPFSLISSTWSASSVASVEDLWGNAHVTPNATFTGFFTATVLPHSSVYVVLHPVSS